MRHALTALVVLLLSVTPARAAEGRVVLDATLLVIPGEVYRMCMDLPPGTVAATTRLVHVEGATDRNGRPQLSDFPIDVELSAYRGQEDTPGVHTTATDAEAVAITPIPGGLYCLSLMNRATIPPGETGIWQSQRLALKLTLESS
jgi:hypothetical protein